MVTATRGATGRPDRRRLVRGDRPTIKALAQAIGVSRSHLSRQLAGERPILPAQAETLAELTGLPLATFTDPTDAPEVA